MKTAFCSIPHRVKIGIAKSPIASGRSFPALWMGGIKSPHRRHLACGNSYRFSPNGALPFQPRAAPWVSASIVSKALKGRPTIPAAYRRWSALSGLVVLSVSQPRASLRFALGWYGSAPLGLIRCRDQSPHSKSESIRLRLDLPSPSVFIRVHPWLNIRP